MDLEKLKRIKNLIIAKILFVFGWIYDLAMRILNAVNKTPIEKDKDRRNVRIKQFAIATSILYVIFNSIFHLCYKVIEKYKHRQWQCRLFKNALYAVEYHCSTRIYDVHF